ncbi:MAG: HAMP domain-containing sensor histidine kinase [Alphaproteobacteria bacterium]|nr:HAMP domain-containing sensor histidine kinase [Alphaproteobacteria bacterium]
MDAMALDIRTMAIMAALTSVLQAAALVTLWRAAPHAKGPREWALGASMLAAGMLLISFRHLVPDWVSVILANALIVAAHGAYLAGINRYQEQKLDTLLIGSGLVVTIATFCFFTYVDNNVSARIVVISIVIALLSAVAAVRLVRGTVAQMSSAEWLVLFMLVAHVLFHSARGAYTYFQDQGIADFMQASIVHGAAFADIVIFSFVAGLGFSIMTVVRINRRLEEELDSRTTLLSVIAHDVRSPFTALVGLTNMVSRSLESGDTNEARILTGKVSRAASDTLTLIEDLLVWSKEEFNASSRVASRIDLHDLMERTVRLFDDPVIEKRLDIRLNSEQSVLYQYADEVEMVVRNLMSNAIRYSPQDGTISIESSQARDGTEILISNSLDSPDDGGPEAGDTSLASARRKGGAGIGLQLCRKLCAKAGHSLHLERTPQGAFAARFLVRELPA